MIMTKRDCVKAAIRMEVPEHVPTCFSLHFPKDKAFGAEGVKSHLEFFAKTDTDVVKLMNEYLVPDVGPIQSAADWAKIPVYQYEGSFIEKQIEMAKQILDGCDPDAYKLGTLHGICACAIHPIEARYGYDAVREMLCTQLREDPTPVVDAYKRLTDAMCILAEKYAEIGMDGIYYAGLGGERRYFTDEEFEQYLAPLDKQILKTAKDNGVDTFLHMCKDGLNLERYTSYMPLVDVVNWGVYENGISLKEGKALFGDTCVMGGLANRSGVLVRGNLEHIRNEVHHVIRSYGKKGFILGADCTLSEDMPYETIRSVVEFAREV